MLLRKIDAVLCENHKKHTNTLREHNKAGSKLSNL
jgi:hypothetical protein